MMIIPHGWVSGIALLLLLVDCTEAFLSGRTTTTTRGFGLWMGLYDRPLPPRPPPLNNDDEDEDEEDIIVAVSSPLFQFNALGQEVNNLLPPLRRPLDKGIPCYFEPNDRMVQNLIDKTSCAVEDACWALEACQGDMTEAWTRISVARRNQLNQKERLENNVETEFQNRKQARLEKEQTRQRLERMKRTKPDTPWLPISNPKPIDDEPWFTG
ncbi:hypothetical protein FisN_13Hu284 [Fistulifera solaris]|uniref:Uncharacterized protein n=1 Tax=Fistulifera solaris TaxID=1519565 RepID=A0A1Z5KND4_FISSO|nr:hypothetical protein FisN_13Hu284 [Fistulifera solaris]|eukprot:GAX27625.1 hypothetical protein FisN_13Hu284 [Fistulifera solaris]